MKLKVLALVLFAALCIGYGQNPAAMTAVLAGVGDGFGALWNATIGRMSTTPATPPAEGALALTFRADW